MLRVVKGRRDRCFIPLDARELTLRYGLILISESLGEGSRCRSGTMRQRLDRPEVRVRFPCIQQVPFLACIKHKIRLQCTHDLTMRGMCLRKGIHGDFPLL